MPHTDLPESTPDLDDALHELRERMANSGVMVGIIADLRRNSDRLKPMMSSVSCAPCLMKSCRSCLSSRSASCWPGVPWTWVNWRPI
jgi:hypothetical protein